MEEGSSDAMLLAFKLEERVMSQGMWWILNRSWKKNRKQILPVCFQKGVRPTD